MASPPSLPKRAFISEVPTGFVRISAALNTTIASRERQSFTSCFDPLKRPSSSAPTFAKYIKHASSPALSSVYLRNFASEPPSRAEHEQLVSKSEGGSDLQASNDEHVHCKRRSTFAAF